MQHVNNQQQAGTRQAGQGSRHTSILMPLSAARLNTSLSMMSAICFTSFLVSCLKTMISSKRFKNSGLRTGSGSTAG
jgi:hypothetical protein